MIIDPQAAETLEGVIFSPVDIATDWLMPAKERSHTIECYANIRRRLGGSANMLEPFPSKPKGMRWYTYWWMEDQRYAFHWTALIGMSEQIGMKIDI